MGVRPCLQACIISPCDQTPWKWITRTVRVYWDFLRRPSTWSLVDCESALHLLLIGAEREGKNTRHREKEGLEGASHGMHACKCLCLCVDGDREKKQKNKQPAYTLNSVTTWLHAKLTQNMGLMVASYLARYTFYFKKELFGRCTTFLLAAALEHVLDRPPG